MSDMTEVLALRTRTLRTLVKNLHDNSLLNSGLTHNRSCSVLGLHCKHVMGTIPTQERMVFLPFRLTLLFLKRDLRAVPVGVRALGSRF